MKLTAKFPIWEITCAFSKLLKMLASGSVSTSRPPKSGFVVPVDLMISLEHSYQGSVSAIRMSMTVKSSARSQRLFHCLNQKPKWVCLIHVRHNPGHGWKSKLGHVLALGSVAPRHNP